MKAYALLAPHLDLSPAGQTIRVRALDCQEKLALFATKHGHFRWSMGLQSAVFSARAVVALWGRSDGWQDLVDNFAREGLDSFCAPPMNGNIASDG